MLIRKIYYLRKLLKQQWMKKSELEIIQNKMLKGLIEHSYKFVPFYKNLMKKNNVSPGDIKNSEDRKNQITNMSLSVPTLEQTI